MTEDIFPVDFSTYKIGNSYSKLKTTNINTTKLATLSLVSQARHSIDLFTPVLDPRILDNQEIAAQLNRFIKISPNSRFRILLADPDSVIKNGHCILELSRRLSSFISIRKINEEYKSVPFNLMMVDKKAFIYRAIATEYNAEINYDAVYECRQHLEFFNDVWDRSEPASEIRQLFI